MSIPECLCCGLVLVVAGLFWSLFARIGLGRLPGDIVIEPEKGSILRAQTGFPITVVSPSGEFARPAREFAEDCRLTTKSSAFFVVCAQ